jgi:ribonuclease P protein component
MLKKEVLRRKSDFSTIYNRGKSVGERLVVLFHRKNDYPYKRQAFLASKKVGKSVQRNRARRLMKESWRVLEPTAKEGTDYIFIARNSILNATQGEVQVSMYKALRKAGLLKDREGNREER